MLASQKIIYFIIFLSISALHIYVVPFSDLEESFNLETTHDILYYGFNLSAYEHGLQYPNDTQHQQQWSTFLAPLALAAFASPFRQLLGTDGHNRFPVLLGLRFVLAAWLSWSLSTFADSLGYPTSRWFVALTSTQFLQLFRASRALPDTLALALALPAMGDLLLAGDSRKSRLLWAVPAALLCRWELLLMLVPAITLQLLATAGNRWGYRASALKNAAFAGLGCSALSLAVDSAFWSRPVCLPELSRLVSQLLTGGYFLTALNHRLSTPAFCLLLTLPFALAAPRVSPVARRPLAIAGVFLLASACLPAWCDDNGKNKDLGLGVLVAPLFNAAAAAGCSAIFSNRQKSIGWAVLAWLGCVGHVVANAGIAALWLAASASSYPGGEAASMLHSYLHSSVRVHAHFCSSAVRTGGWSRFLRPHDAWQYSRTPSLVNRGDPSKLADYRPFTHVIAEPDFADAIGLTRACRTIGVVSAFDGFDFGGWLLTDGGGFDWGGLLRLRPALLLLEKPVFDD